MAGGQVLLVHLCSYMHPTPQAAKCQTQNLPRIVQVPEFAVAAVRLSSAAAGSAAPELIFVFRF